MASPSIAICAIARNEALYAKEWIAFHLVQGVAKIVVFDNGSDDATPDILARVQAADRVMVVDWPSTRQNFDNTQRAAYLEGARLLANVADLVVFIDLDEFVYSATGECLASVFAASHHAMGAMAIEQRIFGSSGHQKYHPGPVTSRFRRCMQRDDPEGRWFKTAARPELIERFDSVHSVVLRSGDYLMTDGTLLARSGSHPGCADRIAVGPIRLNHYMLKSVQEFRWKQKKWSTTTMANRYTDQYFHDRDKNANLDRVPDLAWCRDKIDQAVESLWPPQFVHRRRRAPDGPYSFGLRHRIRKFLHGPVGRFDGGT